VKVLAVTIAGAVAVVLAATLGPAALAGDGPSLGEDVRVPTSRTQLSGVNFVEVCRFSHRAPDDPIVFPGKAGASHDHSFVGSRSTSASSTHGSLRTSPTTCRRPSDTSAYWVPTLSRGTQAVFPVSATIYYRRTTIAPVTPFPRDLRVIAGSAIATSPQPGRVTWWSCGGTSGIPASSAVPTCPDVAGSWLRLHVRFPECWDGARLDSPDHKSHMAYATSRGCPSTHPVAVPAITQIYRYPTRGGEGFSLASGGQFSAHADFLNAWRQPVLKMLVESCLNALVHCGQG
jgi:Domain of unknown function (DUF1996)